MRPSPSNSPAPQDSQAAKHVVDIQQMARGPVPAFDDELELDAQPAEALVEAAPTVRLGDTADLYGIEGLSAQDPNVIDDDHANERGQNWLEALQTSATEDGPAPEHVLDVDEDGQSPAATAVPDGEDIPVADRGSGGVGVA